MEHISGWGAVKNSGTDGGLGLMLPESGGVQKSVWVLTTVLRYVITAGRAQSNGQPWLTMKFSPPVAPMWS